MAVGGEQAFGFARQGLEGRVAVVRVELQAGIGVDFSISRDRWSRRSRALCKVSLSDREPCRASMPAIISRRALLAFSQSAGDA